MLKTVPCYARQSCQSVRHSIGKRQLFPYGPTTAAPGSRGISTTQGRARIDLGKLRPFALRQPPPASASPKKRLSRSGESFGKLLKTYGLVVVLAANHVVERCDLLLATLGLRRLFEVAVGAYVLDDAFAVELLLQTAECAFYWFVFADFYFDCHDGKIERRPRRAFSPPPSTHFWTVSPQLAAGSPRASTIADSKLANFSGFVK